MRDLLEHAPELTLIDFNDEELARMGRLHMKLCLANVECVLQSGKKATRGKFVDEPIRHSTLGKNVRTGSIIDTNVMEQSKQGFSGTTTPVIKKQKNNSDHNQSLSNHLITTPISTTESVVTLEAPRKEVNLGVVIDMLQRTQEQLWQVMKNSDEQFQLVLTKSEEQNSRLLSLERKINCLISRQRSMDTTSMTLSQSHPELSTNRGEEDYDISSDVDSEIYVECENNSGPRKRCEFTGCQETFSIVAPHNKREFCDIHSPWRQLCKNRNSNMREQIRYQPKHRLLGNHDSDILEDMNGDKDDNNDDFCYVCRFGGELILCDYCTLSYHVSCAGLKCAPRGDFKCPMCCDQHKKKKNLQYDERPLKECEFDGCYETFYVNPRQSMKRWCDYHRRLVKNERQRGYRSQRREAKMLDTQGIKKECADGDYISDDDEDRSYFVDGMKECTIRGCSERISRRFKFCSHHARIKKLQRQREWLKKKRKLAEIS